MNQESLKFEITLKGTHWGKLPQYSIWLNDQVVRQSEIGDTSQVIHFERTVYEGPNTLKIRLENKAPGDTKVVNGEIVSDLLLNIEDVKIDDISIGELLWESIFVFDEPQHYNNQTITQIERCVNLGFNGTYILKFTSPFYIWLLENL